MDGFIIYGFYKGKKVKFIDKFYTIDMSKEKLLFFDDDPQILPDGGKTPDFSFPFCYLNFDIVNISGVPANSIKFTYKGEDKFICHKSEKHSQNIHKILQQLNKAAQSVRNKYQPNVRKYSLQETASCQTETGSQPPNSGSIADPQEAVGHQLQRGGVAATMPIQRFIGAHPHPRVPNNHVIINAMVLKLCRGNLSKCWRKRSLTLYITHLAYQTPVHSSKTLRTIPLSDILGVSITKSKDEGCSVLRISTAARVYLFDLHNVAQARSWAERIEQFRPLCTRTFSGMSTWL